MRKIKFTDRRIFDYGDGDVVHEAGDTIAIHDGGASVKIDKDSGEVSLRSDKAQRWVSRAVAMYVNVDAENKEIPPKEPSDDKPVAGAADVAGADGGDPGERTVDVAAGRKGGAKAAKAGDK